MTHLIDTLYSLEKYLGIDVDTLYPIAQDDDIGGYHPDEEQRQWDTGAVWAVEGQTLYALIRSLKPLKCVEIGSGKGCSTVHMADALYANKAGHLTTIDRGNTPRILEGLKPFVTVLPGDAIEWLAAQTDNSIDFIFEDGDHSEEACRAIGELAKRKLAPGGVLVAHDAAHFTEGAKVTGGYERAGLFNYRVYLTEPSDCGLLVWKKNELVSTAGKLATFENGEIKIIEYPLIEPATFDEPVLQAQEDNAPPKPRKPRAKKAAK